MTNRLEKHCVVKKLYKNLLHVILLPYILAGTRCCDLFNINVYIFAEVI